MLDWTFDLCSPTCGREAPFLFYLRRRKGGKCRGVLFLFFRRQLTSRLNVDLPLSLPRKKAACCRKVTFCAKQKRDFLTGVSFIFPNKR